MKKLSFTLILILPFVLFLSAQNTVKEKIMIFPFNPAKYSNDASALWERNSDKSYNKLKKYLRTEFNRTLKISMVDSCKPIDILQSYTEEIRNDLLGVYTSVSYDMRKAMPDKGEENKKNIFDKIFKPKEKEKKDTLAKTGIHQGEIRSKRSSNVNKYLHINFSNENFIKELCKRKDVDKVIFITQFEIKGIYGDPYISGNPDAKRKLKVHYCIFGKHGELLHGSFAKTTFPFTMKEPEKLVEDYYPRLVRKIISNIDFN